MSEPDTVIVAHSRDNDTMKRAFRNWERAREWRDAVALDYMLTEVLVIDD